ncbi:MAG TPA: hypothetical protein VFS20_06635 [Longimicrobium sp.]|nr:hypothetical protein [Longimicrobium sp.]
MDATGGSDRSEALAVLETALSDIGNFRWWAGHFPDVVQLEFSGVQVYTPPPAPDRPPRGMLALACARPTSVSFLWRDEGLPDEWPTELHNDRLEPLPMSLGELTLRDPSAAAEMLSHARHVETVFGTPADEVDWSAAPAMLVFWAGEGGVAIAAERIGLMTHDGEVALDQVPEMHAQWWRYWREYWDRLDTPDAMPYDWMCEVTIPIRGPGEGDDEEGEEADE